MSDRSARKRPAKPSAAQLRSQIKRLDREIIKQLNGRAQLVRELSARGGELQEAAGPNSVQWQRLFDDNKGPLSENCIRAVFRELVSGIQELTAPVKVGFLGPEYSYSHLAAVEHFGNSVELVPVSSISAVFEEVDRGQVDLGVVPIENSTDGRVVDTLDMFSRLPIRICAEVQLRICHNLISKSARPKITEVYSKPQALSQCRNWLAKHLPQARTAETASTTAAAELAAKKRGAAAIASCQAATHYGLNVIAAGIEDSPNNVTRFVVIGHEPASRSGKDKTALMFEITHQPGALADVMSIFKRNRMNLTWIESFPKRNTNKEYLFFIEFEGHPNDTRARRALDSLKRKVVHLEVLGAYARTTPIG